MSAPRCPLRFVDTYVRVHAGHQDGAVEVHDGDLHRYVLVGLLWVRRISVRAGEKGEHPGGRSLDCPHLAGDADSRERVDRDVDRATDLDVADFGLLYPCGEIDVVEVVCGGQFGAGGDVLASNGVVDRDSSRTRRPDRPIGLGAAAHGLDPPDYLFLADGRSFADQPICQRSGAWRVDVNLVSVDLRIVGGHIVP